MDNFDNELHNIQMKIAGLMRDLRASDNTDKRFLGYAMQYFDTAFTMAFRVLSKKKSTERRKIEEYDGSY